MNCDEYLMKQIDELKRQLHEQEEEYNKKIEKLQNELMEIKEKSFTDKYELKVIVKEGMYEAIEKFEEKQEMKLKPIKDRIANIERDVKELQTEKFKKWQFAMKTALAGIITATVGWLVNSLISNFAFLHR